MQHEYNYSSFDQDVIGNNTASIRLPKDFRWVLTPWEQRVAAVINPLVTGFSWLYRLVLRIQVSGPKLPAGAVVFANHTQPLGDVFTPRTLHQRVSIIAGAANLNVPVLGRWLRFGRALLLPETKSQMRDFLQTLRTQHAAGSVILLYPEAHVWPYYTEIRPFSQAAMHYPLLLNAPVYTLTTTYGPHRRRHLYLDGPLTVSTGPLKQQQAALHRSVLACMQTRAQLSQDTGVRYRRQK